MQFHTAGDAGNTAANAETELETLEKAESFISGFEGDSLQEGIDAQLVNLRALIDKKRAAAAAASLLRLARRVANLNPNYPEIGDGMLVQLVTEARYALTVAGERP